MDIMQLKIKSRHRGDIEFYASGPCRYILVSIDGGDWRQPCEGGGFRGDTLLSGGSQAAFEKQCRSWWRAYWRYQTRSA